MLPTVASWSICYLPRSFKDLYIIHRKYICSIHALSGNEWDIDLLGWFKDLYIIHSKYIFVTSRLSKKKTHSEKQIGK
jgi:hypothetical protein